MCPIVDLNFSNLGFIELLGCIDSCLSSNLGNIWPLFLQIFLLLLSLFSPFGGPITFVLLCLMVSIGLLGFIHFFNVFFILLRWIILVDLSLSPQMLSLSPQICCWILLVNFFLSVTVFFLFRSCIEFIFLSWCFMFGEKLLSCDLGIVS